MRQPDRDELILRNTGLAYAAARRLWATDPVTRRLGSREDAEQEALRVLVIAADKFDPSRGCKFSTFATTMILQRVRVAAMDTGVIRIPPYLMGKGAEKKGREKRAAKASAAFNCLPLPEDLGPPARDAEETADPELLHRLRLVWSSLHPRHARVLSLRFGVGGEPKPLAAIGARLGVSKERVRQLEAEAIKKLRALLAPAA